MEAPARTAKHPRAHRLSGAFLPNLYSSILTSLASGLTAPSQRIRRQAHKNGVFTDTFNALPRDSPDCMLSEWQPSRHPRFAGNDQGGYDTAVTSTAQFQAFRRTEAGATAQVDDFHGAQLVTCHGLHRVSPPLSQCMHNGEKTCRVTGAVFCQCLLRVPPTRRAETRANARNARNNPPPQSGKTRLQYRRNPDPSVTASAPTHRSRKASRKQNPLRVRRASIGSVTYNAS